MTPESPNPPGPPDYDDATVKNGNVRVDCYVRTSELGDPTADHLAELRRLARQGAVDELSVRTWPKKVVLSAETDDHPAVERFRTFERWAAQWEVSVEPPFARETHSSTLTGETKEVLRTPAISLAVSVNGRLEEVFPHQGKSTTYTIDDALDALEDRERIVSNATPESRPRSGSTETARCPRCDDELMTGQGLYACPGCEWVGIASGRGTFRPYDPTDTETTGADGAHAPPSLP